MDVLWRAQCPLKVRDVLERLDTGRDLAYTTVMTVLDSLHRKDWVTRERDGKATDTCLRPVGLRRRRIPCVRCWTVRATPRPCCSISPSQ